MEVSLIAPFQFVVKQVPLQNSAFVWLVIPSNTYSEMAIIERWILDTYIFMFLELMFHPCIGKKTGSTQLNFEHVYLYTTGVMRVVEHAFGMSMSDIWFYMSSRPTSCPDWKNKTPGLVGYPETSSLPLESQNGWKMRFVFWDGKP